LLLLRQLLHNLQQDSFESAFAEDPPLRLATALCQHISAWPAVLVKVGKREQIQAADFCVVAFTKAVKDWFDISLEA